MVHNVFLAGSEHNLDHWRGTVDCTGSDVSFEPADSSRENRVHVGQLSNGELNLVSSEDGDIQIGHNENTKYHCNFCPKEYLTKHYYEAHLKLHKGQGRFFFYNGSILLFTLLYMQRFPLSFCNARIRILYSGMK